MASRFYLSSTIDPGITPSFAAWNRTSEGDRRHMSPAKDASAMADKAFWANQAAAANSHCLARQYISDPLSAGIAFAIGDTIKCQVRCMESATNDNINRQPIEVKVVSQDGNTLRATLLALAHYGPNTTEWLNGSLRNKIVADGDALTAAYTTVAGDRLVIEVGGQVSAAGGNTVTGTQSFGSDNATDLGENETDTAAYNPWFEISRNVTFLQTVSPTGIASQEVFGTPSIVMNQIIQPSGLASGESLGLPKLNLNTQPVGIASQETFGTPKVNLSISPSAIPSDEALGIPKLNLSIQPTSIGSEEIFGEPTVNTSGQIVSNAGNISSEEIFGLPKLVLDIKPTGIGSQESSGNPKINLTMVPDSIASSEVFGLPKLNLMVTAYGVTSAEAFGSPSINPKKNKHVKQSNMVKLNAGGMV